WRFSRHPLGDRVHHRRAVARIRAAAAVAECFGWCFGDGGGAVDRHRAAALAAASPPAGGAAVRRARLWADGVLGPAVADCAVYAGAARHRSGGFERGARRMTDPADPVALTGHLALLSS